ncbi:MAG: hypothetical protein K0Q73_8374 [Paenibacillus sp.]|nr:hypothetical protein [Paenibacillus sp.]
MRSQSIVNLAINCFFIALIGTIIVIAMNPQLVTSLPSLYYEDLQSFKTMFISIILEAFPFILLGVLVSAFMQIFISVQMIQRFTPKNPFLGIVFACVLGILFPICECGLIPVIRQLLRKGMPLYIAVVFILVGPIVNPIVFSATYMAFRNKPEMVYSRMGLALLVGAVIGLIVYRFVRYNPLKHSVNTMYGTASELSAAAESAAVPTNGHTHRIRNKFSAMLEHSANEFFDMGRFLIFGSLVAAAIQTFVPRSELIAIGQGDVSSHFFMMGLAYILSLCSTADAFVASSFVSTFSIGSLLTFLVFGPMLDLKSTIMLLSVFRAKFVLLLSLLIIGCVFLGSVLFEYLIW